MVEKNLKLHIYNTGDHAEIQHWGVFKDDVLYVNNGRGGMFQISTDAITEVENGTKTIYMHDPGVMPWPKADDPRLAGIRASLGTCGMRLNGSPLSQYFSALFEPQTLQPEHYQQLFLARYLALFLRDAFDLLPICLATGEQGSGKSTLFEKVLWLMKGTGPESESEAMPKDLRGFIAKLTDSHMVLFDNVDGVDWKKENYADYICKASTGGTVGIAQLYQTNGVKNYKLRCDQFYTARMIPWPPSRTDVGRRTLIFPMRKPEEGEVRERETMKEEARNDRDIMLLETLVRLQNVLRGFLTHKTRCFSVTEMPEYEQFTMRVAGAEGWHQEMKAIWVGYMGDSMASAVEHNPMVNAVRVWLGEKVKGTFVNADRWVRASEIFGPVQKYLGKECTWRSSSSFGTAVRSNLSALRTLGMETKVLHGYHRYKFCLTPGEAQNCEVSRWECLKRLAGVDQTDRERAALQIGRMASANQPMRSGNSSWRSRRKCSEFGPWRHYHRKRKQSLRGGICQKSSFSHQHLPRQW
jgi:hypothetical protein